MSSKQSDDESVLSDLAKQCIEDSERWFGDSAVVYSIPHHTLALAGEVGELANLVKKIERGSLDIHDPKVRYELMMETTDVFVYLLNVAGLLRIDLFKSYMHVRSLNEERFIQQRQTREAGKK